MEGYLFAMERCKIKKIFSSLNTRLKNIYKTFVLGLVRFRQWSPAEILNVLKNEIHQKRLKCLFGEHVHWSQLITYRSFTLTRFWSAQLPQGGAQIGSILSLRWAEHTRLPSWQISTALCLDLRTTGLPDWLLGNPWLWWSCGQCHGKTWEALQ